MATQSVTALSRAGIADLVASAVAVDVAGSDKWTNTGAEFVYVHNGNAGSLTITLTGGVGLNIDGINPTAKTFVLAAGKDGLLGPFPSKWYNDASNFASLAWSLTSSVKMLVVQFPGTPANN